MGTDHDKIQEIYMYLNDNMNVDTASTDIGIQKNVSSINNQVPMKNFYRLSQVSINIT